jgi:hypothetical protein
METPHILSRESMVHLIQLLTKRKAIELSALKTEFKNSSQLINIGKLFQESITTMTSTSSPIVSKNFVKNIIGRSAGFLINKLYSNKPGGFLAKISKLSLEIIVGRLVAKHSDKAISLAFKLVKSIVNRK